VEAELDAIVVGGGHNGLVAAGMLARAGLSVLVLERAADAGGAVQSGEPFAGVPARLSRFSYLVSLLPPAVLRALDLELELRPRAVASYSPAGERGLLITRDEARTQQSMTELTGDPGAFAAWRDLHERLEQVARRVFPTLIEPLRSREEFRELIADPWAWQALFDEPLSGLLERTFSSDLLRGIVLTDGTIGTFAPADDPQLRQNRCFLYHVIGNGTGRWDVPVGGMGVLSQALIRTALASGARIATGAEVVGVQTAGRAAEVVCADGRRYRARHVLAGVAPAVLARLLDEEILAEAPEGSQLKLNMVVSRLPRLRDSGVLLEEAFAGTLHVNEGYGQLQAAYAEAAGGRIPTLPPCEIYCHSLTDPSILSAELRRAGAHTLTVFGLHMPARLFRSEPRERRDQAVAATLASVNSILAEPLDDCLLRDADGHPCLEAVSPVDLERELAMPGGHIFHRDLAWPFAESEEEVGRWGVETAHPNVWLCGAGARRGGGVSGIPGHNAARAVLAALA
jgi:phytoene dehydrogenase-like protein